jgi:putative hydrolase of the HAD superfamily
MKTTIAFFLLKDGVDGPVNNNPDGFRKWMITVARNLKKDFSDEVRDTDFKTDDIDSPYIEKKLVHKEEENMDEVQLYEGARQVLEAVKAKGGKVAIISNGFKGVQYRKMNTTCIHKYVDAVIVSEEVGVMKPSPIIFRKALEAICGEEYYRENPSRARNEAIMVGDDFDNDIEGAQIFGIDQFYYNPYHRECDGGPTYESDNLATLLEHI